MSNLTDLLHILACQQNHATDMMEIVDRKSNTCYYYLENDVADGDFLQDHTLWRNNVEKFNISMGFKDDGQALEFIKEVLKISHQIQNLAKGDKGRLAFIKSLINV